MRGAASTWTHENQHEDAPALLLGAREPRKAEQDAAVTRNTRRLSQLSDVCK